MANEGDGEGDEIIGFEVFPHPDKKITPEKPSKSNDRLKNDIRTQKNIARVTIKRERNRNKKKMKMFQKQKSFFY